MWCISTKPISNCSRHMYIVRFLYILYCISGKWALNTLNFTVTALDNIFKYILALFTKKKIGETKKLQFMNLTANSNWLDPHYWDISRGIKCSQANYDTEGGRMWQASLVIRTCRHTHFSPHISDFSNVQNFASQIGKISASCKVIHAHCTLRTARVKDLSAAFRGVAWKNTLHSLAK